MSVVVEREFKKNTENKMGCIMLGLMYDLEKRKETLFTYTTAQLLHNVYVLKYGRF